MDVESNDGNGSLSTPTISRNASHDLAGRCLHTTARQLR